MRLYPFYDEESEIGASSVEESSVEGEENATSQTEESQSEEGQEGEQEDITQQESFAKRLKESVDKEKSKWQQDLVRERQAARDAWIAEQGYEWQGKPITTEAEYRQALKDKQAMDELKDRDLPDEVVQELVENRKFRESFTQKEKQNREFQAFFEAFPDVDAKSIPASVWEDYNNGRSLVDAYTRYENQSLKQKLAELQKGEEVEQRNRENAESSTGSVTGKGTTAKPFFTQDEVNKMTQDEVNKNWNAIMESQKKWYQ